MKKYYFLLFILYFIDYGQAIANPVKERIIFSENIFDSKKETFRKGFLFIINGIITKISENYQKKESDVILDFSKKFIIPGLIDAHTHLFLIDSSFDKNFPKELIENSHQDLTKRKNLGKKRAKAYLNGGFTSVRDLGNAGNFLAKSLSEENKDFTKNIPRIFYSGPGLCVLKCQFHQDASTNQVNKEYRIINDKTNIDNLITTYKKMGVTQLKIYLDNIPSIGFMGKDLFTKIMNSAQKHKLKIAAHAIDSKSIDLAIKFQIHSLEHGYDLNKDHFLTRNHRNIIFVPTDLSISEQIKVIKQELGSNQALVKSKIEEYFLSRRKRLKLAHDNFMPIAFGSDYYFPVANLQKDYISNIRSSIYLFKQFGFSNKDILKFLTVNGAKALNENRIGSIEKNHFADFLILNDNPLLNINAIENINSVFLNGMKVKILQTPKD